MWERRNRDLVTLRFEKLSQRLRERSIDVAILSSLASLRYFSGYVPSVETGPNPFSPLPGAVLWCRDRKPLLLLADMESTADVYKELEIDTFASYSIENPPRGVEDLTGKLVEQLKRITPGTVGVELVEIPAFTQDAVRAQCKDFSLSDISSDLAEMRMIKDEEEIEIIREACGLCDVGQELAKKFSNPDRSELEAFEEVRKGMELKAGGRLPMLADFVSGIRTADIGGPPSTRRIEPGDLVISDLVPRHKGYWGDSCNTCCVGEPSPQQRGLFAGIAEALGEAIGQIRPGLRACELDSFLRARIQKLGESYPHHSGHGVGLTWHEEPRIVPYNKASLRAGMVIAIEPGIYFQGQWGMRLEHTVLVTETGAEILTHFQHAL